MPRFKSLQTTDYQDELDSLGEDSDEAFGEGAGVTGEEQERLRHGTLEVRQLLGPSFKCADREIEDTLWYYYYDVPKTVDYLLNQKTETTSQAKSKPREVSEKKLVHGQLTLSRDIFGSMPSHSLAKDSFCDIPWLNVPLERRAHIIEHPSVRHGGLLGGSLRQENERPKSKLAALAAARRKENQNRTDNASATHSIALLDKLKAGSNSTQRYQGSEDDGSAYRRQSTAEGVPGARKYLSRSQKLSKPLNQGLGKHPTDNREDSGDSVEGRKPPSQMVPKSSPSSFATVIVGQKIPREIPIAQRIRCHDMSVIAGYTADVAQGFSGPSPDDKVLKAQNPSKGVTTDSKIVKERSSDMAHDLTQDLQDVNIDSKSKLISKNIDVPAELARARSKRTASFVVIGHVDAGKSTLMGRLLHELNVVEQRTVEKYRKESERVGKGSFALAWVLDQGTEERERGVTIDIANFNFETAKTQFTILDAPGHRDFIPNMIAGASQADFALLVIDAGVGNFESGLKGQTREHVLLVRSIGVQRVIVAVNKLDMVDWSKDRFDEIYQQMLAFLTTAGFQEKHLAFVPCSGLNGDNIINKSKADAASWYKGPPLITLLEDSEPVARAIEKPFRLTIDDIFRGGVQNPLSVSGRLDAGTVQIGELAIAMPASQSVTLKGIEVDNVSREWAVAGQIATLHLVDVDPKYLKPGDVLSSASSPVRVQRSFFVKVLAFEHIMPMPCEVHRGRLHVSSRIAKLEAILEKGTGSIVKGKKPKVVKPGALARIMVEADEAIPIETGNRVILRAKGETIGAGLVEYLDLPDEEGSNMSAGLEYSNPVYSVA